MAVSEACTHGNALMMEYFLFAVSAGLCYQIGVFWWIIFILFLVEKRNA